MEARTQATTLIDLDRGAATYRPTRLPSPDEIGPRNDEYVGSSRMEARTQATTLIDLDRGAATYRLTRLPRPDEIGPRNDEYVGVAVLGHA